MFLQRLAVLAFSAHTLTCAKRTGSSRAKLNSFPASIRDPRVTCALNLKRVQLTNTEHIILLSDAPWLTNSPIVVGVPVSAVQLGRSVIPVHNLESDVVLVVTDGVGNNSSVREALAQVRRSHARYLLVHKAFRMHAFVGEALNALNNGRGYTLNEIIASIQQKLLSNHPLPWRVRVQRALNDLKREGFVYIKGDPPKYCLAVHYDASAFQVMVALIGDVSSD